MRKYFQNMKIKKILFAPAKGGDAVLQRLAIIGNPVKFGSSTRCCKLFKSFYQ